MAKKPTITTIASGYYSRTALNNNFEELRDAFDNTVSLDGSAPNAMSGDLDLGANDLLNVGKINGATATGLSADLTRVAALSDDITTLAAGLAAAASESFLTVAELAASGDLLDDEFYPVFEGNNGEIEYYKIDTGSTTTADGSLIVELTGVSGRAISTRVDFANLAEILADRRTFADGIVLTTPTDDYSVVSSSPHLTNAGSQGIVLLPINNTYSMLGLGPDADGTTNDKTEIDLLDVSGVVVDLGGKSYEYGGTFTPTATFVNGNVIDNLITQRFEYQRKGQVTGDVLATQGYLAHDDGRAGNTASAWKNTLTTVRGTATVPDSNIRYAHTANFTELHTDVVLTTNQSVWGNPFKVGAVVGEAIAGAGFGGELNGGIFRAYSSEVPESTVDTAKNILVGMSAIGQTNTGSGNTSHSVWGANIIAAQTSGNAVPNVVGIEVDVLNMSSSAGLIPGEVGATNYTGYWAQSDAAGGSQSDSAFLATNTASSGGWRQIISAVGKINNWAIYLETTVNSSGARGIYAKTAFGAAGGRVMELWAATNEQFRVDGASDNPVHVRLGSALKKLEVGASDSGGAGYKVVRVAN